ncbi:MAG TPA: type II and III secretion system protein, partial [Fervidobacterium sp.]|nr:type II and III secretion system protein [Fervidobacterium sp.]
ISKSAIQQAQSYVTLNPNDTVNIDVKAMDLSDLLYQTSQLLGKNTILDNIPETKVTIRLSNVGFDELLEYLKPYGIDYEKKTNTYRISKSAIQQAQSYVTLNPNGNVNIDVKAMDLSDLLYQTSQLLSKNTILDNVPEMKVTLRLLDADFDGVLAAVSSYVSYEKRGSLYVITKKVEQPAVETQQATTVAIQPQTEQPISQKVSVVDKLISIKIEDERISDVIKEVFEKLGYSIIFQKPIDSKATMSVNNIDFDTFQSIIMNYGIVLKRSGNLYYVDITPEATKVITTYTFNVSRGADKVKELIEFYGGTALVNTDAGIIIAYNLDPKNVDEINKMIDRVSTVRVVSIETKIVDEALSSGFGYDMTTMLSSASSVVAGTDGLTLTLKVADMANLQNFLNSLVQNTEVSIKTTGSNVAIPSSTVGNSKLLASPNIMAKSGEDARIFIGDSIPIILTQKDSSGNTSQTLQILESGIELRITPYVNSDNTIDLDLYTSVGNFDYSVQVSGYPKTNKREATTKVTLKDGQTLVIGGLAREETSTSTWKVPILGDLPIIGNLFKGTKESTEQRNIIIFLTAKIIEN